MENILAAGRQRRLLTGIVLAVVTLALAVALVVFSSGAPWFVLVFVLALLTALLLLQARDRT